MFYKLTPLSANIDTDINMVAPREKSLSHQNYNSRKPSVSLITSSVLYYKRIEYQNSNLSWSKQVETKVVSLIVLGNLEQGTNLVIQISNNDLPIESQHVINKTPVLNNILSLYIKHEITVLVEINI